MLLTAILEHGVEVVGGEKELLGLHLQFKSRQDLDAFLVALEKGKMSDEQYRAWYARENGLGTDGTPVGSGQELVEAGE